MKRAPAAELTNAERPDKAIEPVTEPKLPISSDYGWHGSAGGEIARLRAERDAWKAKAVGYRELAEKLLAELRSGKEKTGGDDDGDDDE